MGDVYCAKQKDLARTVAVKLLRPDLRANPHIRQRFQTEANVGGRIRHPNVVAVHDYGEADGAPYLVLEHVRGTTLAALLASQAPLTVRRALTLTRDLLSGLAEAHAEGIVHADVTPDNVLVGSYRDGTEVAKLLDFGLARFVGEAPREGTLDTVISGTPQYLAPETIRGVLPSPQSDVYGAGIVLYELLTGYTPFHGRSLAAVLRGHLEDDILPPSLRCGDRHISCAIDSVVMRAIAKNPDDRFKTADQFLRAIVAALPREVPPELAFATDVTHHDIRPLEERLARGSGLIQTRDAAAVRRALGSAISRGDIAQIVYGYLELARLHIDARAHKAAANELEEAVNLLTHGEGPTADLPPEALWRVLLPLASIYARLGDRSRALSTLDAGRRVAERYRSIAGSERVQRLRTLLRSGR